MMGLKYKLAHKRAKRDKWSASDWEKRKRLIEILKELIKNIKSEMVAHSKNKVNSEPT
jgi:adenine-specific DNA methylase